MSAVVTISAPHQTVLVPFACVAAILRRACARELLRVGLRREVLAGEGVTVQPAASFFIAEPECREKAEDW